MNNYLNSLTFEQALATLYLNGWSYFGSNMYFAIYQKSGKLILLFKK